MSRALVLGALLSAGVTLGAALWGCDGVSADAGSDEPIRVTGATFETGDLPGSPLPDGGTPKSPDVTFIASVNNVLIPGQAGRTMSGNTSPDTSSVAMKLGDAGTGYWLITPGSPDPAAMGALTWSATFDVAETAPRGLTTMRFAAIDANGKAGTQNETTVCVLDTIPDNLNACDPTIQPPMAVLSLEWDSNADLDIIVVTPSGEVLSPKHPSTAKTLDGGLSKPDASVDGILDHDSNANCVAGNRRENVVWQGTPAAGTYLVYVDMYSACGEQAARFQATLWLAQQNGKDWSQVQKDQFAGELLAIDANAGATKGLYVGSFTLPEP